MNNQAKWRRPETKIVFVIAILSVVVLLMTVFALYSEVISKAADIPTPGTPKISDEELTKIVHDVAQSEGLNVKPHFEELPLPAQLANLPGWNYVELRQQCYRDSGPENGNWIQVCKRYVLVHLDDPGSDDAFVATLLSVYPDRLKVTASAGAFSIYTNPPSPEAVIEQYGLADLISGYCQLAKTVTFRVNMYSGAVSDKQVVTCSQ